LYKRLSGHCKKFSAHFEHNLIDKGLKGQIFLDVARSVNAALVMLYWKVGNRIRQDILREKRAGYGEEIVPTLSAQLVPDFGKGFGVRNLFRMIKFAEVFPEDKIVSTLSTQLSWSHIVEIIPPSQIKTARGY
jgi:hypothetical protein